MVRNICFSSFAFGSTSVMHGDGSCFKGGSKIFCSAWCPSYIFWSWCASWKVLVSTPIDVFCNTGLLIISHFVTSTVGHCCWRVCFRWLHTTQIQVLILFNKSRHLPSLFQLSQYIFSITLNLAITKSMFLFPLSKISFSKVVRSFFMRYMCKLPSWMLNPSRQRDSNEHALFKNSFPIFNALFAFVYTRTKGGIP